MIRTMNYLIGVALFIFSVQTKESTCIQVASFLLLSAIFLSLEKMISKLESLSSGIDNISTEISMMESAHA